MKRIFVYISFFFLISCGRESTDKGNPIITVSIAPYKYFIEAIAGSDFQINVMVPAGSNPHIYEPYPGQISRLRRSVAYISNGYLGFEMTWLDRFYETNSLLQKLSLGDGIVPLASEHHRDGEHVEGADPHYWVSPKCALTMAASVKNFLCRLNPPHKTLYASNYDSLIIKINALDKKSVALFSELQGRRFVIYHPNLGYLARDYGLQEVPVEFEGKEPSPSRMRMLIDLLRNEGIKTIFVQKEYDTKNARAIASETGASIKIIDPLSADWLISTTDIIEAVHQSLTESQKR